MVTRQVDRKVRRRKGPLSGSGRERDRFTEIARPNTILSARFHEIARNAQKDLNDVISDEPLQDLEDSELNDWERQQAIARERTRREGLT
jgi:hypothetical protein